MQLVLGVSAIDAGHGVAPRDVVLSPRKALTEASIVTNAALAAYSIHNGSWQSASDVGPKRAMISSP
jgi:hypothetical protein